MKNKILLFLLLCVALNSYSQEEILRKWDPNANLISWNTDSAYFFYTARFDLPAPGELTQLDLQLAGDTGTCFIYLFGQEGGTPYPSYITPLMSPYLYKKTEKGSITANVYLPNIYLDNTQFFVIVQTNWSGVSLLMDDAIHETECKSTDGGDLFFMRSQGEKGGTDGPHAFAIDCHIIYESKTPHNYLKSITKAAGIDEKVQCKAMAAADFNGDDLIDLLITGKLYLNNGNGTFTDKTTDAGLSGTPSSNLFADMDNDGNIDILFIGVAGATVVYLGDGTGKFTQKDLSTITNLVAVNGVSLTDIDNDSYLDLFIGQISSPWPQPSPNYLYFNKGSKSLEFEDKTTSLKRERWTNPEYPQNPNRMSRGSMWIDYDNDGDQDLYVTNYRLQPDEFYKNNGDGTFTDISKAEGIAQNATGYNHGTGVDWADYDNDGDMDLLLCQFAHPRFIAEGQDHRNTTIYNNQGASKNFSFVDTFDPEDPNRGNGIQLEETFSGGTWGDINNDGLVDFYETVYYGCRFVKLYIQNTDHTFSLKTWDFGIDRLNRNLL